MTEKGERGNPERPADDFGTLHLEYGADGRLLTASVKGVNDLHLDQSVIDGSVMGVNLTPAFIYTYYTCGSEAAGGPAGDAPQPAAGTGQAQADSSGVQQSGEEKKSKQRNITRDDVRRVYIEQLAQNKGEPPSSPQLRTALHNHGSLKTICKYKKELDQEFGPTANKPNAAAIQDQVIKDLTAVLSARIAEYKIGQYEEQLKQKQEELDYLSRRYFDETKSMADSYDEINLQNEEHTAAVEELRRREKEHIETISRLQTKVCQLENKLNTYRSIAKLMELLKIDPNQIAEVLKVKNNPQNNESQGEV